MDQKISKKGQIAIWVILAIVIVAVVVVFYFVARKAIEPTGNLSDEQDPKGYIERCARKATLQAIDIMLPQGGFLNPTNYKLLDDTKISYLCRNNGNYLPCINQHPMYLNEMKAEILSYVKPRVEQCFVNLKDSLEKNRYIVDLGPMDISVSLAPNRAFVNIERKMKLVKNIEVQNFEDFSSEIITPLYDLGLVAIEIASQEAKYCYFEYLGYMILYSRFEIEKEALDDSTKIYGLTDRQSGKKINFAIRSCAIPPGI